MASRIIAAGIAQRRLISLNRRAMIKRANLRNRGMAAAQIECDAPVHDEPHHAATVFALLLTMLSLDHRV